MSPGGRRPGVETFFRESEHALDPDPDSHIA